MLLEAATTTVAGAEVASPEDTPVPKGWVSPIAVAVKSSMLHLAVAGFEKFQTSVERGQVGPVDQIAAAIGSLELDSTFESDGPTGPAVGEALEVPSKTVDSRHSVCAMFADAPISALPALGRQHRKSSARSISAEPP
jgi:hypothetical protein